MARLSAKLRSAEGGGLVYWCQGCKDTHCLRIAGAGVPRPCWTWDGNVEAPTFSPSVLVTYSDPDGVRPDCRCHTFVRAGMVQFLNDCTHALAGQTLPVPDWPYAEGEYGGV